MKKILVTGGTGFIGHHSLPFLLERDYDVHITVRNLAEMKGLNSNINYHNCNLFDPEQLEVLLKQLKPNYLLHFAWEATPGKFWTSGDNLLWVETSLKLLRNFTKYGGERVVFAGTCAEYDWNYGYCTENVTPTNPQTLYGIAKNSLRQIFEQYCQQMEISYAWGRIFWLYGINEHPDRLVPSVINNLLKKQPAKCTHGEQIRDFMYVEDLANAFVSLMNSEVKGIVNIASGKPITIQEIVVEIAEQLNSLELLKLGEIPSSPHEPPLIVANTKRLNQEVNFQPKFKLKQGLQKTIDSYLKRHK